MINVEDEIKKLVQSWGKANVYYVGGYVRDLLMGIKPKDYDLVIDSPTGTTDFIEYLKENQSDKCSGFVVYERYGTAKFTLLDKIDIECVIPRVETYNNGPRKPDSVNYTNIKEDAKRRDFCCNALYKNVVTGEILDPTGFGLKDIENKILRTPLDPEQTFIDDPLRMLRAFRFAYRKNFTILPSVKAKIKPYPEYKCLSMERVRDEFTKMLMSNDPVGAIKDLHETGLLEYIIPELEKGWGFNQNSKYHSLNLTDHLFNVLNLVKRQQNLELNLAALLHDISKSIDYQINLDNTFSFRGHEILSAEIAKDILDRLKYPSSLIDNVVELIKNHMIIKPLYNYETKKYTGKPKKTREIKINFSLKFLTSLMYLIDADNLSHAPKYNMPGQVDSFWQCYRSVDKVVEKERDFIGGKEIMETMGIKEPGLQVGEIKNILQSWHLENPEKTKQELFQQFIEEFNHNFWSENGYIYFDQTIRIELSEKDIKYLGKEKKELNGLNYPRLYTWLINYKKAQELIDQAGKILWGFMNIPEFKQVDITLDDYGDVDARIQWKNRKDDYIL